MFLGGANNASSPIGHVYHVSAPPSGLYSKYYDRSHSYHHPIGASAAQQPTTFQPKSVSPICDMRGRSSTETDNTRQRVRIFLIHFLIFFIAHEPRDRDGPRDGLKIHITDTGT